jgi:MraZ protein
MAPWYPVNLHGRGIRGGTKWGAIPSGNGAKRAFGSMFLSSFESSVDAKKRVSIPAAFRKALGGADSVFLWPSLDKPCIEGAGQRLMEEFDASMSELDLMDPRRIALANYIMGEARQAKLDEGGRIVLDAELLSTASIGEKAKFVGLGDRFQIWEPYAYEAEKAKMRALAKDNLGLLKAKPRRPGQVAAE